MTRRQPDGITCGPACIGMMADILNVGRDLDTREIGRLCGTNPRTGTTDTAMKAGLDHLGISWSHPDQKTRSGTSFLADSIKGGNAVFLRTLLGGVKHWMFAHGCSPKGRMFTVDCPAQGRMRMSARDIEKVWAPRDRDCLVSPKSPGAHPDLRRRTNARRHVPIHEMSLGDFVPKKQIIKNPEKVGMYVLILGSTRKALEDFSPEKRNIVPGISHIPGMDVFISERGGISDLVLSDSDTGYPIAGIFGGTPFCREEDRGRGLGAELLIAAYNQPEYRFLAPFSYSEAGYGSRLAAHRIAVERAHEAGLEVSHENLERYGLAASGPEEGMEP